MFQKSLIVEVFFLLIQTWFSYLQNSFKSASQNVKLSDIRNFQVWISKARSKFLRHEKAWKDFIIYQNDVSHILMKNSDC